MATVGTTICSQMHVQIMYSLAYLQDLITTLAVVFAYIFVTFLYEQIE